MKRKLLAAAAIYCMGAGLVNAENWRLPSASSEPKLKSAPGVQTVSANCQVCHSLDYISTQPPLNRAAWTGIVQKMRQKFGAPLPAEKVDDVVNYIVENYGAK